MGIKKLNILEVIKHISGIPLRECKRSKCMWELYIMLVEVVTYLDSVQTRNVDGPSSDWDKHVVLDFIRQWSPEKVKFKSAYN